MTFALLAISARGEMGGESSKFYLLLSELITGKQMIRGEQKTALLRMDTTKNYIGSNEINWHVHQFHQFIEKKTRRIN